MAAFALNNLVGLARQIIVLNAFGTSGEMDAFIAANRVSETLFTLVAGGALASAFIPTFTSILVKDDERGAWKLASAIANLIRDLKRDSSKWVKSVQPRLGEFHWQSGYGAFSVSPAHVEALKGYIAKQCTHHRRETFEDELRRVCRKYGLEIDERYAWD